MSKFTSLIRRAPKRFSALAVIIAAAIIIPSAAFAWGPSRDTFSIAENRTSDHVQFNSYVDNPNVGDERNFVGVRESGSANTWYDSMNVQSGKTYIVRMYVHNNAATDLNLTATGVKAKVNLPTTTGTTQDITGFVDANNVGANAKGNKGAFAEVYDDAKLTSSQNFNLAYVAGSLKYENNMGTFNLPESIFTQTGAALGYKQMDGNIPGCFQYAGYVSFEVKPQFATPATPDFSVSKQVRKAGASAFSETVAAKAGDTLNYRINYTNTSKTSIKETAVMLKDSMPKGVTFVPGSVQILNAQNQAGATVKDGDKLFTSGINIGDYTAGSNALIVYNATVDAANTLPVCGTNTLVNTASAQPYNLGPKSDTATVTTNKECTPPPAQITVCELATKKIVTINESAYDTKKYSKNLDDCKTPSTINVCELATNKIVNINEADFDAKKYSRNLDDCKTTPPAQITVCELTSKSTVTINESDFDASKYSRDLNDCQSVPPTTPPELPHTGMSTNIVAIVGLGALIASAAYYIASRRALNQ